MSKKNVLVLCTGNSCRSQMAEVYLRKHHKENCNIYSAGIEKHGLNPFALGVLVEAGEDISPLSSKLVTELNDVDFDVVITVCSHADENCPVIPGNHKKMHQGFNDPSSLSGSSKELIAAYRKTREEIAAFCEDVDLT